MTADLDIHYHKILLSQQPNRGNLSRFGDILGLVIFRPPWFSSAVSLASLRDCGILPLRCVMCYSVCFDAFRLVLFCLSLTNRFSDDLSDLDFCLSLMKLCTTKPLARPMNALAQAIRRLDLSAPVFIHGTFTKVQAIPLVVVAWFNTLETWFGPGRFSLYSISDADFHMVCL